VDLKSRIPRGTGVQLTQDIVLYFNTVQNSNFTVRRAGESNRPQKAPFLSLVA